VPALGLVLTRERRKKMMASVEAFRAKADEGKEEAFFAYLDRSCPPWLNGVASAGSGCNGSRHKSSST
jgi:hypothetical protein